MLIAFFAYTCSVQAGDSISDAKNEVAILSNIDVVKGHSYTGEAAVTVKYKNGVKSIYHYEGITIDYGLEIKYFKVDNYEVEYQSSCERLTGDPIFRGYLQDYFGRNKVAYILVELLVKKWN